MQQRSREEKLQHQGKGATAAAAQTLEPFPSMHMCVALQDGLDGKVLAEELLALESQFRSSSMNPMGGTKMANDWTVTIDGGAGR